MKNRVSWWISSLGLSLMLAAWQGACGDPLQVVLTDTSTSSAHSGGGASSGSGVGGNFVTSTGNGQAQSFDVQPSATQTIVVNAGQSTPTVTYTATLDGKPEEAAWTVDRAEIGAVPSANASAAIFTPTGSTGGLVLVTAKHGSEKRDRWIQVQLHASQNGADPSNPETTSQIVATLAQLKEGGGPGGVGGEGLGEPVTDASTLAALANPGSNGAAEGFKLLYPYDSTVWPRGLLAPLLQWDWVNGDADAIRIELTTSSKSFTYEGTFARPAILSQTLGKLKFIRHPIPQDVWRMATNSAGGRTLTNEPDKLTLKLTIAKDGKAFGPITQTWSVAPGRLAGTVYYNSYGTQLVKNSDDKDFNEQQYGAAVLAIKGNAGGPTVVAGESSGFDGKGCRVCHVVAANGSRLIVQQGHEYSRTSTYDLQTPIKETSLNGYEPLFGWAGLSPDGALAFTNAADLATGPNESHLYAFPPNSISPISVTGIPSNLRAGTPVFSPDGTRVAFDFLSGTIGNVTGDGTQLVTLKLAPDADAGTTSYHFSDLRVLATMPAGDPDKRAGFPSFFPTNDAVAYHYQLKAANHRYNTWHGATAQVWWSDLASGTAAPLAALNGMLPGGAGSYLPTGPNNHGDDTVLNYEPTVNPLATGGYIWVIFTSRRLYGSVAHTDPWQSDPREYDATNLANVTTKKLWVAAIDLDAKAGVDPSHPAFYLPGQELLAGNTRGFWVLDPCKKDGQSCESGDQCCGGFCQPGSSSALVCSNMGSSADCSMPQEKCVTATDCCDQTNVCINGYCTHKLH